VNHCIKRANRKAARPIRQRLSGPYPAIFIGGCAGTAARSWVGDLLPGGSAAWTHSSAPWATLAVNLAGAFLLGLLTAVLASRFPNADPRIRLLLGTGLLGSFTTYGTFAAEVKAATPTTGAVYAAGSILCGLLSAWAGLVLGAKAARGTSPSNPRSGGSAPAEKPMAELPLHGTAEPPDLGAGSDSPGQTS
jgi:CrcB-like protein